jgi:hypothetical protein
MFGRLLVPLTIFVFALAAGRLGAQDEKQFDQDKIEGGRKSLPLASKAGTGPDTGERDAQVSFRVRSDFAAKLNADRGWAGALNENATVYADDPFRVRFELELAGGQEGGRRFRLQYRRNAGDWTDLEAHQFPAPAKATPRVSIASARAFKDGAATTNLLAGSTAPFAGGAGVSLADTTAVWEGTRGHGEWEWPLVIRRYADGAVTSDPGDTFEFRMAEADRDPFATYQNPVLKLAVRDGHVGGTFVETPGRIGPWQASGGDLYFIMEPAETDNRFMMVKSSDGGRTWKEVDGANRPRQGDLEGVASQLVGDTIHVIHQSREVRYHSFRTADHPTLPDTWDVRGEPVASPGKPPTQAVSLAVRSDGSVVAFYAGPGKVRLKVRAPGGEWGDERVIDDGLAPDLSGPAAVRGAGDVVHLAYTGADGTAWYRRLLPDGELSPRQQIAEGLGTSPRERISILPLVHLPKENTVVILYRLATGRLWERRVTSAGEITQPVMVSDRDVIQSAVDSHQTGADAIAHGDTVHVLFIEKDSGGIFSTRCDAAGAWQPSALRVDGIRGQWVRGGLLRRRDGASVYGYVYDAGSRGGSGMNRFAEMVLGAE